ncbi:hypothetical protein J437_LFUL010003 [Ladona fulva]|uniref:Uncharacterized protein n=1 Tax=Ladona fulva TaxID=123851 RepID=A0A8K0P163_LADFU|nr:hypothetical protein J437_LFUL010003 [Ladona fulva]
MNLIHRNSESEYALAYDILPIYFFVIITKIGTLKNLVPELSLPLRQTLPLMSTTFMEKCFYAAHSKLYRLLLIVAMGRSHSTPGLVESRGRIPIEDMWLSPVSPVGAAVSAPGGSLAAVAGAHSVAPSTGYSANSLFSPGGSPSSRSHAHARTMESPLSGTSSAGARSSEEEEQRRAQQGTSSMHQMHPLLPPMHQPPATPGTAVATSVGGPIVSGAWGTAEAIAGAAATPSSHDALIAEITRLRERLITLEAENASLSVKLSQQQWDVEHRLAEIEMQICGGSSAGSTTNTDDNNERNRESII